MEPGTDMKNFIKIEKEKFPFIQVIGFLWFVFWSISSGNTELPLIFILLSIDNVTINLNKLFLKLMERFKGST